MSSLKWTTNVVARSCRFANLPQKQPCNSLRSVTSTFFLSASPRVLAFLSATVLHRVVIDNDQTARSTSPAREWGVSSHTKIEESSRKLSLEPSNVVNTVVGDPICYRRTHALALTREQLCSLPHHHRQGIASLAFSKDGRRLATVGVDSDKSLAVWRSCSGEWYDAELQVTSLPSLF